MMPLLFGLIGTSVNFSALAKGTIPKSVGIVFAGEPMPSGLFCHADCNDGRFKTSPPHLI